MQLLSLKKRTSSLLLGLCAFLFFAEGNNNLVHGFVSPPSSASHHHHHHGRRLPVMNPTPLAPQSSPPDFCSSRFVDLFLSSSSSSGVDEDEAANNNNNSNIRFLGKGPNAIVRPGVVLVAPSNEFHHYYRQSAIFVYAMGEDEDYDNTYIIRGAIIDMPTPFTLGEMAESTILRDIRDNPMEENLIYRGGDKGGDSVYMLHNQPTIGNGNEIGTSGIYQGGLQDALQACVVGTAQPTDFKFFFNFCQFTEDELESMLEDDPWVSLEIPSKYVLSTDWDNKGDCWKQLRNILKQQQNHQEESIDD